MDNLLLEYLIYYWSEWSVINYPELISAFCWFIFVFIIENARSKKQNWI